MMEDGYFAVPSAHPATAGGVFRADFQNWMDLVRQVHPLPVWDSERFEDIWKMALAECRHESAEDGETGSDFRVRVNRWLARLRDAHTFVMPDPRDAYPYVVRYFNGSFYVHTLPDTCPDYTGKTLAAINGQPMAEIAGQCYDLLPSENAVKACIVGSFFLNQEAFLRALGMDIRQGVHFTLTDGSELELPVGAGLGKQGRTVVRKKTHPVTEKVEAPYAYRILDDLCYFQFNAMYDRCTYLQGCRLTGTDADEATTQALPLFSDFLGKLGVDLKKRRVRTLVVDLRNNGGGNSLLGDQLLQFLGVDLKRIRTYQAYVRPSHFLHSCYPHLFPQGMEAVRKDSLLKQSEVGHEGGWEWPEIAASFSGQVFFLQGQNTFSSANYLLTTVKDNALFPTLGASTSQKPTCFGDVLPVRSPLTGVSGFVSYSYFIRPNAENTEDSLSPDIPVVGSLEEYLAGEDPCWEWIERHR